MGSSVCAHCFTQLLYSDGSSGLWLLGIAWGRRTKSRASVVQGLFLSTLCASAPTLSAHDGAIAVANSATNSSYWRCWDDTRLSAGTSAYSHIMDCADGTSIAWGFCRVC